MTNTKMMKIVVGRWTTVFVILIPYFSLIQRIGFGERLYLLNHPDLRAVFQKGLPPVHNFLARLQTGLNLQLLINLDPSTHPAPLGNPKHSAVVGVSAGVGSVVLCAGVRVFGTG